MDKHLRALLSWSDEDLDEALAQEPANGVYQGPQSPNHLMFSRDEIEAYNAAFHSDNATCERIIATVQDRVRQLQEIRRFRANQRRKKEQQKPAPEQPSLFGDEEEDLVQGYESLTWVETDPGDMVQEKPAEETEHDLGRILSNLRDWHRDTSEQLVDVNRELLQATVNRRENEIADLTARREQLQSKLTEIDAEIQAELQRLKKYRDAQESESGGSAGGKNGLVRVRHPNRDFFLADLFDYALKDDGASMEAPIFTLSTKPDLSIWKWTSKDGNKSIKVAPSVLGRATQHDKDVLIYVVSQLAEALNRGRDDAQHRTVRFTVYDFLVTTNRGVGGDDYRRLQEAFERLAGTRITTDIKTGGERVKEGFGIIDAWRIIEKSKMDERMIAVEVTLSRWLYNAVQAWEILTIHPDYFRLRKPLARRLYEIARKHCGHQTQWIIGLPLLHEKSGSRGSIYEFHEAIKEIAKSDILPEYRLSVSQAGRVAEVQVTFYVRESQRLMRGITKRIDG